MFDGILFDLDGTLWDALEGICLSWNRALARFRPDLAGAVTPARLKGCMGMLLPDIAKKLFPQVEPGELAPLLEVCCDMENEYLARNGGVLCPGAAQALPLLAEKYPLFIVSNCQDGYIESFFAAHGLGRYFTDWECPGRTGRPKAENIRAVAARNGLRRPVYVGDTRGDFQAASAAGVPFLHAAYGFGAVEGVPAIGSLVEPPALLEELNPGEHAPFFRLQPPEDSV